jgi:uncharacterized protein YciI
MRAFLASVVILFGTLVSAGPAFPQAETQLNRARYFFVLLTRPSHAAQLSKEAGEALQEEHMSNIRKLHAEHKLVVAGPFTDDTSLRGIFVLQADSAAQAQDWVNSDPAIKAGHLVANVYGPWAINPGAIHEPSTPEGMEQYTLALLKSGEKWNPSSPEFMKAMKQHAAFVKEMTERGNIAIAGMFPSGDRGDSQGVEIFRVGMEPTAKLAQSDPAVKAGLFTTEIHPWITGKGVLTPGQPMKP